LATLAVFVVAMDIAGILLHNQELVAGLPVVEAHSWNMPRLGLTRRLLAQAQRQLLLV